MLFFSNLGQFIIPTITCDFTNSTFTISLTWDTTMLQVHSAFDSSDNDNLKTPLALSILYGCYVMEYTIPCLPLFY